MADEPVAAWPRPYFKPGDAKTDLLFVCFGSAPLAELQLSRERFGLPSRELLERVDLREHLRAANPSWFEGWWTGAFGAIAKRDLGPELSTLTACDVCYALALELEDQPTLAPQQTIWGLSRWLCERGAHVVLDVHAFRFRTRAEVEGLSLSESDVERDVKLVFENQPTEGGLHLLHTRGLCKFGRPDVLCYIRPDDLELMGRALNQVARRLMEGETAEQIQLRLADAVELATSRDVPRGLIESLGLPAAVRLGRRDGAALAGVAGLVTPR